MSLETKHFYEFGPFRIDCAERVRWRDGRLVHLTGKAFDVLLALAERSGHIVERDELIEKVWPDCFVEEGNLTVTISMLRKGLGAGEKRKLLIEKYQQREQSKPRETKPVHGWPPTRRN